MVPVPDYPGFAQWAHEHVATWQKWGLCMADRMAFHFPKLTELLPPQGSTCQQQTPTETPKAVLALRESRQPLGAEINYPIGASDPPVHPGWTSQPARWLHTALDNVHHRKPRKALTQFQGFLSGVSRGQEIKEVES